MLVLRYALGFLIFTARLLSVLSPVAADEPDRNHPSSDRLEVELRQLQEHELELQARVEALQQMEQKYRVNLEQIASQRELDQRVAELDRLSQEVMQHAEISASSVPALLERLESEQFGLELEKIGLEVRVSAITDSIKAARSSDNSQAGLARVELRLHDNHVRLLQDHLDAARDRLKAMQRDQESSQERSQIEQQLAAHETQLRNAKAQHEAMMTRLKLALDNPPEVKELESELRRASIELRVVDAKLGFINERLSRLRDAAVLTHRYERAKNELRRAEQMAHETTERQVEVERDRLMELERRLAEAESKRLEIQRIREGLETQRRALQSRERD